MTWRRNIEKLTSSLKLPAQQLRFFTRFNRPPLLPTFPETPEYCCMSGCPKCVWEVYADEVQSFNEKLAEIKAFYTAAGESIPEELQSLEEKAKTANFMMTG